MVTEQTFDVVVLGAGSTGENIADIVVKGGLSAVLVEPELVGGECSYWACMPSKTLLRGTEVLEEARSVDGARQAVTGEQDVAATLARRDRFTANWDDSGQVRWVEGAGIALIRGGGYVGCEMATAWQALGSQVTIFQRGKRLLDGLEPAAAEAVTASLQARGVEVHTDCEITAARRDGAEVVATTSHGDLRGDELLVAVGRRARTRDIGIETVGLEPGRYLDVDDTMQVRGVPWLYGVGDVNGRRQLTHMGKYQARQAGAAIVARARGEEPDLADWSPFVATADRLATPSVVFTDPQVGSVGLTSVQAAKDGVPHRVVTHPIGSVAGARVFADGYEGTAIAVVDPDREVLLGATFVGPAVADLLQAATIAVVGEVPISRLWHAVPAYPTVSEIWLRLLETWRDSGGRGNQ